MLLVVFLASAAVILGQIVPAVAKYYSERGFHVPQWLQGGTSATIMSSLGILAGRRNRKLCGRYAVEQIEHRKAVFLLEVKKHEVNNWLGCDAQNQKVRVPLHPTL